MKIKKLIMCVLCIAMLSVTLISCNEAYIYGDQSRDYTDLVGDTTQVSNYIPSEEKIQQYSALSVYVSDGGAMSSGGTRIDVSKANKIVDIKISDIPEPQNDTLTVNVLGDDYCGVYNKQKSLFGFNTLLYTYKTDAGDRIVVDGSGNVVEFHYAEEFSHYIKYADQSVALTPEESRAKAYEHLTRILGPDVAARYSAELPDTSATMVIVTFAATDNKFEGYEILDKIIITLDYTGKLLGYKTMNVGLYNNKQLPSGFDDDKLKEIISECIDVEKSTVQLKYNKTLYIMADGRLMCKTRFVVQNDGIEYEPLVVVVPLE